MIRRHFLSALVGLALPAPKPSIEKIGYTWRPIKSDIEVRRISPCTWVLTYPATLVGDWRGGLIETVTQ